VCVCVDTTFTHESCFAIIFSLGRNFNCFQLERSAGSCHTLLCLCLLEFTGGKIVLELGQLGLILEKLACEMKAVASSNVKTDHVALIGSIPLVSLTLLIQNQEQM